MPLTSEQARAIGKKGGEATKRNQDPDFFKKIGKKGGDQNLANNGIEQFQKIGRKDGHLGRRVK